MSITKPLSKMVSDNIRQAAGRSAIKISVARSTLCHGLKVELSSAKDKEGAPSLGGLPQFGDKSSLPDQVRSNRDWLISTSHSQHFFAFRPATADADSAMILTIAAATAR